MTNNNGGKEMKPTKANIDKALHAAGFPDDFEIVKGAGYIYFSGGNVMEWYASSVMIPYLYLQTVEQWVEIAEALRDGECL